MAPPPLEIREIFAAISRVYPALTVTKFDTPTKLGLRRGTDVVLTYNSYRKGWLDTSATLGPQLHWFGFKPTNNKPGYWAVELPPERVEDIFRANREAILAMLGAALGLPAPAAPVAGA